ncbi:hypothetical protein Cgig2_032933 [Carnegiea gigantea]|uniref:Endonuclease/exonuclease/phosphatase domain-containing protein n=1 Tax=Carnegiea gigantea TaxID=171969 RepID=A0A9Q1Q4S3_9CARY|nr:hypothetical protein Cgig2_032933 [Carnegiea gigantea]
MDIVGFWNVRGLNGLNKQDTGKISLAIDKCHMLGLMETITPLRKSEEIYYISTLTNKLLTNVTSRERERISVLWNQNRVQEESLRSTTSVSYGMKDTWPVGRDFSSLLHIDDRIGGDNVSYNDLEDFRDCITTCGLHGLRYTGPKFTWSNKHRIFSRLDANYPNLEYRVLPVGISDHYPLVVHLQQVIQPKHQQFRFFNVWISDSTLFNIVQKVQQQQIPGTAMFQLTTKLKMLKKPLKELNRTEFVQIQSQATDASQKLENQETVAWAVSCAVLLPRPVVVLPPRPPRPALPPRPPPLVLQSTGYPISS